MCVSLTCASWNGLGVTLQDRTGRDAPRTASGFPTARTLLRFAATHDNLLYAFVNPEFSLSTAFFAIFWGGIRSTGIFVSGVSTVVTFVMHKLHLFAHGCKTLD
jgi:hypothetical protein